MRAHRLNQSILLLTSLLAGLASAQELTLFEQVETDPVEQQQTQPQLIVNQNGQPAFTVRGLLRVGDEYRASLVDRTGQMKEVRWRAGEDAMVPGMQGYNVVSVQPRSVTIEQPAGDPCVESPTVGVTCMSQTMSVLSISTAAPLPPRPEQIQYTDPNNPNMGVYNNGGVPQNPFEAAIQAQQAGMQQAGFAGAPVGAITQDGVVVGRGPNGQVYVNPFNGQQQVVDQMTPEMQAAREARQRARADRLGQFQPVRIPDDQIPPGMRRVTTPFGDRLVPERE